MIQFTCDQALHNTLDAIGRELRGKPTIQKFEPKNEILTKPHQKDTILNRK